MSIQHLFYSSGFCPQISVKSKENDARVSLMQPAMMKWLKMNEIYSRWIVHGKPLGSAIAVALANHEVTLTLCVSQITQMLYPLWMITRLCIILYFILVLLCFEYNKCWAALRALQCVLVCEILKIDIGHLGKCEVQLTHKPSSKFVFMPEVIKRTVVLLKNKRQNTEGKDQCILAEKVSISVTCVSNSSTIHGKWPLG